MVTRIILLFMVFVNIATAQRFGVYNFNNNLNENGGKFPALTVLGNSGKFVSEALPELGVNQRLVYQFDKNCGLSFDNNKANNLLSGSYSVEIYFRFDKLDSWKRVIDFKNRRMDNGAYIFNGKLNFYKIAVSELAPIRVNEYTHYILTRDAKDKVIKIYADGKLFIEFIDNDDLGVLNSFNLMNFFYDDLVVQNEASAGAVAYIKLFDYVLNPDQANDNFKNLKENILNDVNQEVKNEVKKEEVINVDVPLSVKLAIKDAKTNNQINEVEVEFQSIKNKQVIYKKDASNSEVKPIKADKYVLLIKARGYFPKSDTLDITTQKGVVIYNSILVPIEVGNTIVLDNIFFRQGMYDLLKESFPALEKLVSLMKENGKMEIELSGHTDNQGDPRLNKVLSENRVEEVKKFLVNKGVSEKRIVCIGYGSLKPIASNAKEQTRKLNRRVEFKVLKN